MRRRWLTLALFQGELRALKRTIKEARRLTEDFYSRGEPEFGDMMWQLVSDLGLTLLLNELGERSGDAYPAVETTVPCLEFERTFALANKNRPPRDLIPGKHVGMAWISDNGKVTRVLNVHNTGLKFVKG